MIGTDYEILIRGSLWTFRIMRHADFIKKHPDATTSDGITDPSGFSIDYIAEGFRRVNVGHELWHAYNTMLYLGSADDLSSKDLEEIQADMMGYHCQEFANHDAYIWSVLKSSALPDK